MNELTHPDFPDIRSLVQGSKAHLGIEVINEVLLVVFFPVYDELPSESKLFSHPDPE